MALRVVQLGSPRATGEGVRCGTVRRPPRGVRRADYSRLDYYDAWLPELAPSESLFSWIRSQPITPARWAAFERRYRREMRAPAAQRLVTLLALLSRDANLSVGCYCDDERVCHRRILRELLAASGAVFVKTSRRSAKTRA